MNPPPLDLPHAYRRVASMVYVEETSVMISLTNWICAGSPQSSQRPLTSSILVLPYGAPCQMCVMFQSELFTPWG